MPVSWITLKDAGIFSMGLLVADKPVYSKMEVIIWQITRTFQKEAR